MMSKSKDLIYSGEDDVRKNKTTILQVFDYQDK